MAVDIGPKIGIDGEAEFRKEINNITQQIKTFGSEMKAVTAEFGKNQNSMEALTGKNEVLTKSVDAQEKKLEALKKGLSDCAAQYGETDTRTLKWQQAVNNASADLSKMKNELSENQSAIENFGTEVQEASEAMDDAGRSATSFGDLLKANLASEAIVGAITTIKDAIKEVGAAMMEYSRESENATVKATAYFGETGEAAKQTEAIIKDVYTDGVGESMDRVSEAVIAVKKNLDGLSEVDMKNLTEQAITLDELYGIDMNETLRGVNSLMQQFDLSAQEAMDYIVSGTQNGLDKTSELGDNLSEYAGKFAQAGYSAEEYFQLLNNGLDNGAYNLDKVNDAINEVTNKMADGSIEDSLKLYSKETQTLFKEWKSGGATQKQVIDSIVSDIGGCTNQQEALTMAATAFGTMAEDGNLKFITSLSSVGDTYSDVSGKAKDFFDATTTSQQNMDSAMRTAKESLAPLGEALNGIVSEILPVMAEKLAEITSGIDWSGFKETLSMVVQAIFDFGNFILENKDMIITALAGIAAGFVAWNVIALIQGVIASISALGGILPALQAGIVAVNTAMAANPIGIVITLIAAVITAIVAFLATNEEAREKVTEVWENIKSAFSEALDAITGAVGSAWEFIKGAFFSALETVKSLVSGAWSYINGETTGQMSIMQAHVTNVFNGIKLIIQTVVDAIKGIIKAGMQLISGDWKGAWETIKTTFSGIWDNIKKYASDAVSNMYTAVSGKVKEIGNSIKSGLEGATQFVSGLPSKFLSWGRDMIGNLVKGIKDKIGDVKDAIGNIADTIRSYIHFSEPDVGPLSDFHTYMPDMSKMLVSGIRSGIPAIEKAMNDLSSTMVPRYANGTAAAYDRMSAQLSSMQIVLDDGTLVGKMAPKLDAVMGGYAIRRGRGNV